MPVVLPKKVVYARKDSEFRSHSYKFMEAGCQLGTELKYGEANRGLVSVSLNTPTGLPTSTDNTATPDRV